LLQNRSSAFFFTTVIALVERLSEKVKAESDIVFRLTMKFFLSCGLLLLASSTALAASVPSDDTAEKHVRDLTTWFRGNGGYFNFKLEIRRADPKDPTSEFGIFARKDIKPKERLIEIPADLIIEPMFDFEVEDNQEVKYFEQREHFETLCDLTLTLIAEMELGDDSDFAAYLNYLNQKDLSMLPVMWSEQGKELMRLLANKAYAADISHPPYGAVDWMDAFVKTGCIDEDDDFEKRIATLVYSRAMGPLNDTVLVPVLDMINHSNKEEERNVECTTVITDDFVHVKASTEIKAGEQLFLSYNKCVLDCQGKDLGTDYLFRAHGFLEPFPQQWDLGDVTVVVDEVEGDNGKTVLEARHVGGLPNEIVLMYLTESIEALQETLHGDAMTNAPGRVPEKELETIHLYHNALLKTLSSAVKQTDVMAIEHKFTCIAEDSCPDEGSSWFRYDDLDKSSQFGLDTYYSMTYQCDTLAFDDRQEVMEDQIESHYQIIEYFSNPKTKEMCFFLDGTWQICTSYRPQYHEMGVHETIRYLPHEPKRILWVGGGDSMFLHEILKYPSLELAVGLELDQKVVRGAFQYFGVQPHWDNEKVQWWFGDASKSLLMLPEDYYRSFDVVLVDLSDTLLSLSVTKEMDIIGALSLLLKPDGVFAMNELVCLLRRSADMLVCFTFRRDASLTHSSQLSLFLLSLGF
jgi:spermidine synthase